jgi:predicted dehydrogenase
MKNKQNSRNKQTAPTQSTSSPVRRNAAAMPNYRAVVLGVGKRGTQHGFGYLKHPRTDLVALCDLDEERLAAAAKALGIERTYTDYRQMLDCEQPDIVNIPIRTDLHAQVTIGVLEHWAPKVVVVEKPMATSLADADRMLALARQNGSMLAVHHQTRTTPPLRVAKRLIDDGHIGSIASIKIRGKGFYGGYGLMDMGTHLFNDTRLYAGPARSVIALCTTAGRPTSPEDVIIGPSASGWIAGENISAIYEFKGGLTAFAELHRRREFGWTLIKIYGSDGALCLHNSGRGYLYIRRGRDDRFTRTDEYNWESYELSDTDRILYGVDYHADHRDEPLFRAGDLWMNEETVRALDEDRPHECSGEEALGVLDMMIGAWESHFTGRRVDLPMTRDYHPLLKVRADAGLGELDPEPGNLNYVEWLPQALRRTGVSE